MLLNAALTVEEGKPGSHMKLWEEFTLNLIRKIQEYNASYVFVLLGKDAQRFKPAVNDFWNYIIERPHPVTEVYSGKKWEHNKLWSEIDEICFKLNGDKIQWLKPLD